METRRRQICRHLRRLVEREPMWDGNPSCGLIPLLLYTVEREPMWDGNPDQLELPFFDLQLSENQCGMETIQITKYVQIDPLSENQCGMETWQEGGARI